MEKFFGINSPLSKAMSVVADTIILSLLWLIGSVSIITIGLSTTAAYYAAIHVKTSGYGVWRNYWKSFRQNWKQALILELICIFPILSIAGGCYLALLLESQLPVVMSFLYGILVYAVVAVIGYVFPLLAYFEYPTKILLKNACLMALANSGWTLLTVLVSLMPLLLLMIPVQWIAVILPVIVAIVPGALLRTNATIFRRVFTQYVIEEPCDNPI